MIRPALKDDCINLAALSVQVWMETYSVDGIRTENSSYALSHFTQAYFQEVIVQDNYRLLVDMDGIYLRGYTLINLISEFESKINGFEIEKLYVHSAFQGRGIGQRLLKEVVKRYGSRFWLYTWVRNTSIEFYKKQGFKRIGTYTFDFAGNPIKNIVLGFNPDHTGPE